MKPFLLRTGVETTGKRKLSFLRVTKPVELYSELLGPLHRQIVPEDETNPGKYSQEAKKRAIPKNMVEKPGSNCA